VYKKERLELRLTFSKEPRKYEKDKLWLSKEKRALSAAEGKEVQFGALKQATMASSVEPDAASIRSAKSAFSTAGRSFLNHFGYDYVEIKFSSRKDRREFLAVWRQFVKPLGVVEGSQQGESAR
jgi:hypothetical protein